MPLKSQHVGIVVVGVTENVAWRRPAIQSSPDNYVWASRVVDGYFTTHYCTLAKTTHPWWSVDLGSPMSVGRVEVTDHPSDG